MPATPSPTARRAHTVWEGGGVRASGAGAGESDASAGARQDQRYTLSRSDETSRSEPFESRASGEKGGGGGAGWVGGEGREGEGDAEL